MSDFFLGSHFLFCVPIPPMPPVVRLFVAQNLPTFGEKYANFREETWLFLGRNFIGFCKYLCHRCLRSQVFKAAKTGTDSLLKPNWRSVKSNLFILAFPALGRTENMGRTTVGKPRFTHYCSSKLHTLYLVCAVCVKIVLNYFKTRLAFDRLLI